jgi:argininosuccinate lyase
MTTVKGLPTSYNKDLQDTVEPLLDCVKTVNYCLAIMQGVIGSMEINGDKMHAALTADMLATDVAEYLVRKGVPFRQTHHTAGAVVRAAEDRKISITELSLKDLQEISPLFEKDISQVFDFEKSVERRSAIGGTSQSAVLAQIETIKALIS